MSDFARLEDKLAKLSQRERVAGEGRRLRGASPEARLAALVDEIDETILPRRLSFAVEGGATVHLAVANRRLQALVGPAPDLPQGDHKGVVDQPLQDAGDAGVADLKDLLLSVFKGEGAVSIHSARPTGGGFPSDVGVPSNILARAWAVSEVEDTQLSPDEILTKFLKGLGDDALAWLKIQGENVTDQGGDTGAAEALGEQAALFLDGYFGKFEALFPNEAGACATLIAPVKRDGAAALFVEIGDVSAFVAARAGRAVAVAGRWQKLTAA